MKSGMYHKKISIPGIGMSLWIGIVLSLSAALIYISYIHAPEAEKQEVKITDNFYQMGNSWEIPKSVIEEQQKKKDGISGWRFQNPYYKKYAPYIVLELTGAQEQEINGVLLGFGNNGKEVEREDFVLQEGVNIFKVDNIKVRDVRIELSASHSPSLKIENVKFMERVPVSNGRELLVITVCFFAVFSVIIGILWKVTAKKRGVDKIYQDAVEILQFLFMKTEKIEKKIVEKSKLQTRRVIRGFIFAGMLLFIYSRQALGEYGRLEFYRYDMLICSICIIGIGLLCWDGRLKYIRWTGVLAKSYFAFIAALTLSDVFVHRRYSAIQYILLFSITFLMFMWQNMKKPEKLMIDLLWAMTGTLVLGSLAWLIFPNVFLPENLAKVGMNQTQNWSEQFILWKQYLYSMNLFGHGFTLKYWGERQMAYNGLLEILYRYGIVGLIPYGIMVGAFATSLVKEIRGKRTRLPEQARVFILIIGGMGLVSLLITNLEFPFISFMWPLTYLMIGWMFAKNK